MNNNLRMLLVEDNPGDAFLIKFYLEESTYKDAEIVHEEFLYSAIDALKKASFNIILLDLNLSDSTGMETLERIMEAAGDAVVIVLTGLTDEEYGRKAIKMGAHDFLVKGQFDGKVLNSSVKYAFESTEIKTQIQAAEQLVSEERLKRQTLELLSGVGYWEYNPSDRSVILGHELKKMLNGGGSGIDTIDDLINIIDENKQKEFKASLKKLVNTKDTVTFDLTINESNYKSLAKRIELPGNKTKVVGILRVVK